MVEKRRGGDEADLRASVLMKRREEQKEEEKTSEVVDEAAAKYAIFCYDTRYLSFLFLLENLSISKKKKK